jgi:hypothetical protein
MKKYCTLLLVLVSFQVWAIDVNVKDYGATGDGTTLDSKAIQKAIDACTQQGGGKVIFPAGKYLSGTIAIKNNITLRLEKDAVILGSTNIEDYENKDPFTDGLGIDVGWALLVAVDASNIGIEGEGAINGQGAQLKAKHILTDTRGEGKIWGRRPFLLRIVRCTGVTVRGVSLYYAAAWTSHYFQSKNITIENVKIVSYGIAHNDGMDIDGCQHVQIRDCDVESGDDALCFKTTSSTMACSDITVTRLRLKSNQAAIKMGTESMAPFENITITNCDIYDTRNGGIKLLTVDGAHLRNILISDITMKNVRTPMLLRLGSRLNVFRKGKDTQQPTGTFDKVTIRNVKAEAAADAQLKPPSGILITGVPGHYISNVTLENIEISLAGGGIADNARAAVPEAIDQYPEVKTFGPLIPAYGIWARHVKGLKLKNIRINLAAGDLRPAFIAEDAQDIELTGWNIAATAGTESVIRLENVQGAKVTGFTVSGTANAFVRTEGKESKEIKVNNNKTGSITKLIDTITN